MPRPTHRAHRHRRDAAARHRVDPGQVRLQGPPVHRGGSAGGGDASGSPARWSGTPAVWCATAGVGGGAVELLRDRALRERLGRRGHERVERDFSCRAGRPRWPRCCAVRARSPPLAAQEHLERQQRPQRVSVAGRPAPVLGEHGVQRRAARCSRSRAAGLPAWPPRSGAGRPRNQRSSGTPKPRLRLRRISARQQVAHRRAAAPACATARAPRAARAGAGRTRAARVEERRAHLQAVGHRRPVDLREQVVEQVRAQVEVEQPVERRAPADAAQTGVVLDAPSRRRARSSRRRPRGPSSTHPGRRRASRARPRRRKRAARPADRRCRRGRPSAGSRPASGPATPCRARRRSGRGEALVAGEQLVAAVARTARPSRDGA